MGWMCSWIAVKGAAKTDVFEALEVAETAHETEPGSRAFDLSFREMPGGWLVIFGEDFDWASARRVLALSHLGLTIGCQFEDKFEMTNILWAARDGVEIWRVAHTEAGETPLRLETSGELPAEFFPIRDEHLRLQRESDERDEDVDYGHDVPHELGNAITGYQAVDEQASFIVLEGPGTRNDEPQAAPRRTGGFFASLFGRKTGG